VLRIIGLITVLTLAGCGAGQEIGEELLQPQKIYFKENGPLLYPWGTPDISNKAEGGEGKGVITYHSEDDSIASVDSSGNLTLHNVGVTRIVATKQADERYQSASASYILYVSRRIRELTFLFPGTHTAPLSQVNYMNPVVEVGPQAVSYSSSNPAVADAQPNGKVLLKAIGKAIITATVDSDALYAQGLAQYTLWVGKIEQSIAFDTSAEISIKLGSPSFTVPIIDGVGSGEIRYFSSNPQVASVNLISGEITPVGEGNCVITAIKASDDVYAEARADFELKVTPKNPEITFALGTGPQYLFVGESFTNQATANYGSRIVQYHSSNTAVATVNPNTGAVTPISDGEATITASLMHLSNSYRVIVAPSAAIKSMAWIGAQDTLVELDTHATTSTNVTLDMKLRHGSACLQSFQTPCDASSLDANQSTLQIPTINNNAIYNQPVQLQFGNRGSNVIIPGQQPPAIGGANVLVFNNKLWRYNPLQADSIWVSSDGVNWTATLLSNRQGSVMLSFGNKLWLFGGVINDSNETSVRVSTDGIGWTDDASLILPNAYFQFYDAAFVFNGRMWLKSDRVLWSSIDGKKWNLETLVMDPGWKKFVAFKNRVWTWTDRGLAYSITGQQWMNHSFPQGITRVNAAGVFANKLWLLSGNSLFSTEDNSNFVITDIKDGFANSSSYNVPFNNHTQAALVNFQQRLWMIGGEYTNDIWSSIDGSRWHKEQGDNSFIGQTIERHQLHAVDFNGTLFAASGDAIWKMNSDTLAWTLAGYSNYSAAGAVDLQVFNNTLWKSKISTETTNGDTNFVTYLFKSHDGASWSLEQTFPGAYQHLAVLNDSLHAFTASLAVPYMRTSDFGLSWQQEAPVTPINQSVSHLLTRDGILYALGGDKLYQSSDALNWSEVPLIFNSDDNKTIKRLATLHEVNGDLWITAVYTDNRSFSLKSRPALDYWDLTATPNNFPAQDNAIVFFNGLTLLFGGHTPWVNNTDSSAKNFSLANTFPWQFDGAEWRQGQPLHFRFIK